MEGEILKRVEALRVEADRHLCSARLNLMIGESAQTKAAVSTAASQLALLELEIWKVTWGPLVRPPHPLRIRGEADSETSTEEMKVIRVSGFIELADALQGLLNKGNIVSIGYSGEFEDGVHTFVVVYTETKDFRYPSPDERGKWIEDKFVDWPTEPGWYWATKSYDTAIVYVDGVGETLTIMRINPGSPGKVGISDEWKWFGPLLSPWEVEDGLHED